MYFTRFALLALAFAMSKSLLPYMPPPADSPELLEFLRDTTRPKLAYSTYIGWYEDGGLNESAVWAQVEVMAADLRPHGWTHILHDYNWQLCETDNRLRSITQHSKPGCIHLDEYGRPLPSPQRYPSAYRSGKAGDWAPFVEAVHAKGLGYGLHLVHGIPKEAAEKRLQILGTAFTADQLVAEPPCETFIGDYWRINTKHPGAQAYYDSLVSMWAEQGIDFIYFDGAVGGERCRCRSAARKTGSEVIEPGRNCECDIQAVALMANSIRKFGRGMFFYAAFGPSHTVRCSFTEISQFTPYFRVGNDTEDRWEGSIENGFSAFTRHVAPMIGPHKFGDLAAMMVGKVHCGLDVAGCPPGPNYYIPSSQSKLSNDEVISYASMIAMFRSSWWPSGVLSEMNDFMRSLLTNDDVIRITMMSNGTRQLRDATTRTFDGPGVVWAAEDTVEDWKYILLVNMCPCSSQNNCSVSCDYYDVTGNFTVAVTFRDLGLKRTSTCRVTDLWRNKSWEAFGRLKATLRPHASLLVRLSNCDHASNTLHGFLTHAAAYETLNYEATMASFAVPSMRSFNIWVPSVVTLAGTSVTFAVGIFVGRLCKGVNSEHSHEH